MPIQPSIAQLHHHILVTQHHDPVVSNTLGIFISAGYQLLPEREIVYDLDTPRLNCIGLDLEGKHLIIDGNIGAAACSQMIGDLTINGRAGPETGYQMIGSLTVNGFARGNVGHMMIGRLKNNGHITGIAGECMLGENDGRWNIGNRRTQFSHDLTNPLGLSHYELQSLIVREYS
jgi:formylmethanofuran dehydrogenase subunit C